MKATSNIPVIGFVYYWTDLSNDMYYVGSHKGSIDDGYIGSGKLFKYAYKKRPESFEREILYIGQHYQKIEDFILKGLDVENDDKSYNLKAIGWGGGITGIKRSKEQRLKMSQRRIGIKFTDEHKANISKSLIGSCRHKQSIKDLNTGIVYPTIKLCCEALGLNRKTVCNAFYTYRNGKDKTKQPCIKNLEYVS